MKKAFTLIELLVVVSIIAILAALLFPVFAQARASAKRTVSLSNQKQISLASLAYSSDFDDTIVDITTWGGNGAYVTFPTGPENPWPLLLQPYCKSAELFVDPQAPAEPTIPSGFNINTAKLYAPEYGMNPYLVQTVSYPFPDSSTLASRGFTSISRPSDIVMFTQKYSDSEYNSSWIPSAYQFYGYFSFGAGSYFITVSADPPDCESTDINGNFNPFDCAAGWGTNSFYQFALNGVQAAGAWTGGGSERGQQLMVVSFTDGHAKTSTPGFLAAGTAYRGGFSNGIPTQASTQVSVTNIGVEHYYGVQ